MVFIPENKPPIKFSQCPLPASFSHEGKIFRKTGVTFALNVDGDRIDFSPDTLVFVQTHGHIHRMKSNLWGV